MTRSPARPNVLQSRDSLLRGRRLGQRAAVTIEHLIDLVEEIVVDHLITNIDGIRKAFGIGSAVALDDHAVEAKQHAAVGLVRVELVAQGLEGVFCKQIADPGTPGARKRSAQEIIDLARRAL